MTARPVAGRSAASAAHHGSGLVLRRGPALKTLRALAAETGAGVVRWLRLYHPLWVAQRGGAGGADGGRIEAAGHPGRLINEPLAVRTKVDGFFNVLSVLTPFWRAVFPLNAPEPLPAPARLPAPETWPISDRLEDWGVRGGDEPRRDGGALRPRGRARGAGLSLDLCGGEAYRLATDRERPDRAGPRACRKTSPTARFRRARARRGSARGEGLCHGGDVARPRLASALAFAANEDRSSACGLRGFPFRGDVPESSAGSAR